MQVSPIQIESEGASRRRGGSLRMAVQIAVSAGLIAVLVVEARRHDVLHRLSVVPHSSIALAAVLMSLVWLINSVRWGLLLRVAGVSENPVTLAAVYYIGMFCSQVLPTSAGGDAVRMWDVARRNGKPAAVVVATLQERLVGMGVSMVVGMVAAIIYFHRLPPAIRPFLLGLPALAILVAVLLYPRVPFAVFAAMWAILGRTRLAPAARRISNKPIVLRIMTSVRSAADIPPLTPTRLIPVLTVATAGILMSMAVYSVLGRAVGLGVSYTGFCLVIPMVWVISMTPSVGGLGVREGAFTYLLVHLLGATKEGALTVAALFLLLQTAIACIGGGLLVYRIFSGTWIRRPGIPPQMGGLSPNPAFGDGGAVR